MSIFILKSEKRFCGTNFKVRYEGLVEDTQRQRGRVKEGMRTHTQGYRMGKNSLAPGI